MHHISGCGCAKLYVYNYTPLALLAAAFPIRAGRRYRCARLTSDGTDYRSIATICHLGAMSDIGDASQFQPPDTRNGTFEYAPTPGYSRTPTPSVS